MFSTYLEKSGGVLGKGFVVAALFPSLAFWLASLALLEEATNWYLFVAWWPSLASDVKVFLSLTMLVAFTLFALGLQSLQTPILRLYEGYWEGMAALPVLGRFVVMWSRRSLESQRRRWTDLQMRCDALGEEIARLEGNDNPTEGTRRQVQTLRQSLTRVEQDWLLNYPSETEDLLPTRLGNILKAAELYPWEHYRMDAAILWSRLWMVLSKEVTEALREARLTVDLLLTTSLLGLVFFLVWVPILIALRAVWPLVVLAMPGLVVAWVSYQATLPAARFYGELIKAAFDIYRWKLLETMHLEPPNDPQEEAILWSKINGFLYRGYALEEVRYQVSGERAREQ